MGHLENTQPRPTTKLSAMQRSLLFATIITLAMSIIGALPVARPLSGHELLAHSLGVPAPVTADDSMHALSGAHDDFISNAGDDTEDFGDAKQDDEEPDIVELEDDTDHFGDHVELTLLQDPASAADQGDSADGSQSSDQANQSPYHADRNVPNPQPVVSDGGQSSEGNNPLGMTTASPDSGAAATGVKIVLTLTIALALLLS